MRSDTLEKPKLQAGDLFKVLRVIPSPINSCLASLIQPELGVSNLKHITH